MVSVLRTGDRSAVEIAALAAQYVEQAARLPQGLMLRCGRTTPNR